jgi:hypothetical protein
MFKIGFSWFLRVLAGVFAIGFIVAWIGKWEFVFKMEGSLVLLLTLIMIIAVAVAFCILNLILIKADIVADLPESKDYIVIPIVVVFIKLVGEISVFIWAFSGIAGFMLSLTKTGAVLLREIPLSGGSGFVAGLNGLVISLIVGFISFFFFYFIAEQFGVLADIARNTKKD